MSEAELKRTATRETRPRSRGALPRAQKPAIPSPRPSKSFWRRALVDPWRKLASLMLAILLWWFLDSQITRTKELVCSLEVVDAINGRESPPGQAVVDVHVPLLEFTPGKFRDPRNRDINSIIVRFSGPSHEIDSINAHEQFYVRNLPKSKDNFLEFDKSMIQGPREILPLISEMEPSRVRLDLEPNAKKAITLSYEIVGRKLPPGSSGDNLQERLDMTQATFRPSSVVLRGTANSLQRIPQDILFEVDLFDRPPEDFRGTEIRASLSLSPKLTALGVRSEPAAPIITIPLRPEWEQHQFPVAILIDPSLTPYEPRDFDEVPEQTITLRVSGILAAELHGKDDAALHEWGRKNLTMLAKLTEVTNPSGEISVTPKAFFPNHVVREGIDYQFDMQPVTLVLRKDRPEPSDGK